MYMYRLNWIGRVRETFFFFFLPCFEWMGLCFCKKRSKKKKEKKKKTSAAVTLFFFKNLWVASGQTTRLTGYVCMYVPSIPFALYVMYHLLIFWASPPPARQVSVVHMPFYSVFFPILSTLFLKHYLAFHLHIVSSLILI